MYIEDIVEKRWGVELDIFLDCEMNRYASKEVIEKMEEVFADKERYRKWFYSKLKVFENERPYDYCKEEKYEEVIQLLGRIEHGVFT